MASAKRIRTLIVDDSPIMAKLTGRNVEALGYDYAVRKNSAEAISYIGNNETDLILMDIELIGSKYDGIQTAKIIRKKHDIPVVFITGHEDAKIFVDEELDASFYVVLKPYDPKHLKMQVEVAMYNSMLERRIKEDGIWLTGLLNYLDESVFLVKSDETIIRMNDKAEALIDKRMFFVRGNKLFDYLKIVASSKKGAETYEKIESVKKLSAIDIKKKLYLVEGRAYLQIKVKVSEISLGKNYGTGYIIMIQT